MLIFNGIVLISVDYPILFFLLCWKCFICTYYAHDIVQIFRNVLLLTLLSIFLEWNQLDPL